MNYAPSIQKAGNSPNGNKLIAKFPGPEFPDEITIKGTSDTQSVNGNSGVWISGGIYPSSEITMQLKVGGVVVMEVVYGADGKLAPAASIINFKLTAASGVATISWSSVKEANMNFFAIDRKLPSDPNYTLAIQLAFPSGGGSTYSVDDTFPSDGTYTYRLRAVFIDGSDLVLQEGNASNQTTPDAVITGYALSAANGVATISWSSTKEVSIAFFAIDRKLSTAPAFDQAVQIVFPNGAGNAYTQNDTPLSAGTYIYKLRALFADGTEKALGEQTITV